MGEKTRKLTAQEKRSMTECELTRSRVMEFLKLPGSRTFRRLHGVKKRYPFKRVKFSPLGLERLDIPKCDRERGGYTLADRYGGASVLVLWDGHRNVQQFAKVFLQEVAE